jgi:uncharacterized membrane protein YGL010W
VSAHLVAPRAGRLPRAAITRRPIRLVLQVAAVTSVISGVFAFVVAPIQGLFSGSLFDFYVYLGGAQAAAHHGDIYALFQQQLHDPGLAGFDYPPLVAWLLEPLTWLPVRVAAIVWLWSMLACTATAAVVLSRSVLPETWPRLELAAIATFAFVPATFNLRLGQMEPLIFLILVLALVAYTRGRRLTCGALIGVAASLKLAPLVLIVLLLRRRWWRAAIVSACTVAASTVIGVLALGTAPLVEYATHVMPAFARQDGWIYNQSLNGVVDRLADHSVLGIEPGLLLIGVATAALGLVVLGLSTLLTSAGERSRTTRGMEFSCGVMAMLLAGSITWYLHYVLLLIPLFAIVGYLAAGEARRPRSLAIAVAACLLCTGVAGALLSDAPFVNVLLAKHGSALWWPLLQLTSLPAISLLALFVVAVRSMGPPTILIAAGARPRRRARI